MNNQITAELRGLLRGALAATEKARDMAASLDLPQWMITRAGLSILSAIAHIEDDAAAAIGSNNQPKENR